MENRRWNSNSFIHFLIWQNREAENALMNDPALTKLQFYCNMNFFMICAVSFNRIEELESVKFRVLKLHSLYHQLTGTGNCQGIAMKIPK